MAKCVHCDYPYATGNKCSNCGSDNPSGRSLNKGGGILGVLGLIFIIYLIANAGSADISNSSTTNTNSDSSQVIDNSLNTSGDSREEKRVENNENNPNNSNQNSIPNNGTAVATSNIAYFYSEADLNTRLPKYIVNGQEVKYLSVSGDFMYVNFTYENIFTEGWMLISDFGNFRSNDVY